MLKTSPEHAPVSYSALSNRRLLLVETIPQSPDSFAKVLEQAGYLVSYATSAPQAVSMAGTVHPEVLLIDHKLAGISPKKFFHSLRSQAPVSVIVAGEESEFGSSAELAAEISRLLRAGADEFLLRPCTPEFLLGTIQTAIEKAHRRAEEIEERIRLLATEERFRELTENLHEIFWMTDVTRTKMLYISPAYEKIFGLRCEDLKADAFQYRSLVHPDDLERLVNRWHSNWKDLLPGQWDEISYRIVRRDGSVRWLLSRAFPVRDASGHIFKVCGITEDITERKLLEEELVHSHKMRAIGELAGGIAHDFNNLLTPILGYSNLLREGDLRPERLTKAAEIIEKAALRAMDLTKRLLGFARRGKHQNVPVDVHRTIGEIIDLVGRTFEKRIIVDNRLTAEQHHVLGDPNQLHQIILNLAINARDAMSETEQRVLTFSTQIVAISAKATPLVVDLPEGIYLEVSVADTGIGIDEETKNRIFEPFFTTKTRGQGSGMGLAMVYGIVKNHGGAIQVESEKGHGATFKVFLPLTSAVPEPVEIKPEEKWKSGSGTVLLVDDEASVLEVGTEMLEQLGYSVVTAADGQEAVDYYRTHSTQINLVILDLLMPRMGAREAFRELKKMDPQIRVILSTGYDLDQSAQSIIDEGVKGFVQKPYTLEQLSRVMAKVIEGAAAAESARPA